MSLMNIIPDILKRFRIPAAGPADVYTMPHSFGVTVNTGAAVPLRQDRTGVEILIAVASIGNAGIIYFGGPECDAASGIELDGGRGILVSITAGRMNYQEFMAGQLGAGLMTRIDTLTPAVQQQVMSEYGALATRPRPSLVIPLNQLFVTASAVGQTLRCLYMLPARI